MTTRTASRAARHRREFGRTSARRHWSPMVELAEPRLLLSAYVVTNTNDSGPGSLRQAIVDANTSSGADVITFNIPGDAVPTIVGDNYQITDPLIIDGTTQPHSGAGPGVQLQGGATNGPGLMVQAPRCTIRGLSIFGFVSAIGVASNAEHTAIQGNYFGIRADGSVPAYPLSVTNAVDFAAPDCVIGGTAAGEGNRIVATGTAVFGSGGTGSLIQGNVIDGPIYLGQATHMTIGGTDLGAGNVIGAIELHGDQNTVQGNLIGLAADGKSPLLGVQPRFEIIGSGNLIGGDSPAARNVVSGGSFNLALSGGGNVIQGNFIGTDSTGARPLITATPDPDDPFVGIWVNGPNNIIGGAGPGAGNLISGNPGAGIMFQPVSGVDQVTGNIVEGNRIGTDAAGTSPLPNGGSGIEIFSSPSGVTIGGTDAGAGNVIAYNRGSGVDVLLSPSIQILGNSIYFNGGLGIDEGALMNPPARAMLPMITYAASGAGGTTVAGTIHDAPNTSVRVELFSNDAADSSGYGEGQTFLGFTTVPSGADGDASFVFNTSMWILPGRFISATATATDSTTEFSADRPVSRMGDVNQDGSVNFSDLLLLAQHYGQSGPPAAGDLNADGRIDFSDLLLLAQNYGSGTESQLRLRTSIDAVRLPRARR